MTWAFAGFSQEPFFEFKDHQKKILEFSGWYEVSQRFVESTVFS